MHVPSRTKHGRRAQRGYRRLATVSRAGLRREDRTGEHQVFAGFTPDVAKNVMARACKTAATRIGTRTTCATATPRYRPAGASR